MREPLVLLALVALVHAARSFVSGDEAQAHAVAGTALAFGLLLLCAFFAGRIVSHLRLPKLVGYIVAGIAIGPYALGLVSAPMMRQLDLVGEVAVCLIALTAGGELNLRKLGSLLRTIASLTLWAVLGTALLLALALLALSPWLPFLSELQGASLVSMCLVLGVVLSAQSPAVVMALLTETGSDGPVSRTVLGTVVIADLVVIVLFGITTSIARAASGGDAQLGGTILGIAWEIFGSIGIGAVVGLLLSIYLRKIAQGTQLFVLLLCVVVAEVGAIVHVDPLVTMLAAGLLVENIAEAEATSLVHELESASLPVFLVFFALAGAKLHLSELFVLALPAAILVAVRAGGFRLGAAIATRGPSIAPEIKRYAWTGLLPQAGLALALALLVGRAFPELGEGVMALLLGAVALNELLMPVVLRWGLVSSGEAGRRDPHVFAGAHGHGSAPPSGAAPTALGAAAPAQVAAAESAPEVDPGSTSPGG